MGFLDRLREKGFGQKPPPLPPNIQQRARADDAPEEEASTSAEADPQTFAMEYIDAAGQPSLRQVTVRAVGANPSGDTTLQCLCHMRGAVRTFRADRIQYIIDQNGEVIEDVPGFIADNLSATPEPEKPAARGSKKPQTDRTKRRNQIRAANRDYIRILVAIARADGNYDLEEEAPIQAFVAGQYGEPLDEADQMWLRNYIHRMNPTFDQVDLAMETVGFYLRWARSAGQAEDKARVQAFTMALKAVIMADGHADEAELDVLRDLVDYSS
jgi:tellurite resistance protein